MNYQKIIEDRNKYNSDEEFISAANAITYKDSTELITYRNCYFVCGERLTDIVYEFLKANKPNIAEVYRLGGGIDFSLTEVRQGIDYLVSQNTLTSEEGELLKNRGRTVLSNCLSKYGVETMTQEIVDAAVAEYATEQSIFNARKSLSDFYNKCVEKINNGETNIDTIISEVRGY